MRPLFLILFFSIINHNAFAQVHNLVPNPSFENLLMEAPEKQSIHPEDFDVLIDNWYALRISPDILTDKIKTTYPLYTQAKTGEVAVGLLNTLDSWTEYISAELHEPLQKGKTYYVEFWYMIVKPRKASAIDTRFGILFNHGEEYQGNNYRKASPQIKAYKPNDTTCYIWREISGTFTPKEAFTHITLGQFAPNQFTNKKLMYYIAIDDILVRETEPEFKMEVGEILVLENIIFKSGTAVLEKIAYASLKKLCQGLLANKNICLAINGHTDNVGNKEDNMALSTNRAKTVYNYLVKQGIDKERLTFQGFGEQQPIEGNDNVWGRKKNRRVEFKVLESITPQQH